MEILQNMLNEKNAVAGQYVELLEPERPSNNNSAASDKVLDAVAANPEDLAARHEFLENTFINNVEHFDKISALRRGKRSVKTYLRTHGIDKEEAKVVMRIHLQKRKSAQHQD